MKRDSKTARRSKGARPCSPPPDSGRTANYSHSSTPFTPALKNCKSCGEAFTAKSSTTQFCTATCYQRDYYHRHHGVISRQRARRKAKPKTPRALGIEEARSILSSPPSERLSPEAPLSDLLTIREFAARIGVCKQTVYNMATAGSLTILHPGPRICFIRWSEFMNNLTSNRPAVKPSRDHATPTREKKPDDTQFSKTCTPQFISESAVETLPNGSQRRSGAAVLAAPCSVEQNGVWCSIAEIGERYGVTPTQIYSTAHNHSISRKRENGRLLYSLTDLNRAWGLHLDASYITVAQARDRYKIPPSTIYYKLTAHAIKTIRFQRQILFLEADFVKVLKRSVAG